MRCSSLLLGTLVASACASSVQPIRPAGTVAFALIESGDHARHLGLHDEARVAYGSALDLDGTAPKAHVGLQEIYKAEGRSLELRAMYRALGTGGVSAFLVGRLEGDRERAKRAFRDAPEPYRTLGAGQLALTAGDWEAAEGLFLRATQIDPGEVWGWIGLGRARLILRADWEAAEAFRHATWIAPRHPGGWHGLSRASQAQGNIAEAWHCAQVAWQVRPNDAAIRVRLIVAGRAADESSHAAELLERGDAESLLASARLWREIGETERSDRSLERASSLGALAPECEAIQSVGTDVGEFVRRLARGVESRYRHFRASGEAQSFEEFRNWCRDLYAECTNEPLDEPGAIKSYAFIGKLVDSSAQSPEPLVRRLAELGLVLVLGQRNGGPPEAMLATIATRSTGSPQIRNTTVHREAIWIRERHVSGYSEWAGGGDLAGLALGEMILVDLFASAEWEGRIRRRRLRLAPYEAAIRAQPALADTPVDSVSDPAGVADRLLFDARLDVAAEVLVHENAHLVDAARYLPGKGTWLSGLGLVMKRGFRATSVMAFLERNAQLAAIAEGPTPRAGLAVCCAALGGHGAHAAGYTEIVAAFVDAILANPARYPSIDCERLVVQQLDRLSDEEIRAIATTIQSDWDG